MFTPDSLPAPAPAPATAAPSAVWPLHILYADGMPELRELMRDRLALDGHTVETAADGEEAVARVAQTSTPFNLIIADHALPRIDGLDLLWHVRQLPYSGRIVILSSKLSPAVNDRYRRCGVDLLLTKPIFPPTFCQMLRQMFLPRTPALRRAPADSADPWVRETDPVALPHPILG